MNIDSFLKIGHGHEICQDYILTGDDPCPYIIIADGCSDAKDSDIGVRILCHAALNHLKKNQSHLHFDANALGQDIIKEAVITKSYFNTKIDCLDATLIIAYKFNGFYRIYMFGDGIFQWTNKDGYRHFNRIYYKPNAPAYLRYRVNGYENYRKAHVAGFYQTKRRDVVFAEGPMEPFHQIIDADCVQSLFVASDGIESFQYKEELMYKTRFINLQNGINKAPGDMKIEELKNGYYGATFAYPSEIGFEEVIKEMTDFKLTSGPFLQRRVKKVMKNYLKRGIINDDDLSIGCFYEDK